MISDSVAQQPQPAPSPPAMALRLRDDAATLVLSGSWRLRQPLPEVESARRLLQQQAADARSLAFDTSAVTDWDSGLVTFIAGLEHACGAGGLECGTDGLPAGLLTLLRMAREVPESIHTEHATPSFLGRLGSDALDLSQSTGEIMEFFGEGAIAVAPLLARPGALPAHRVCG
jgi:phospholipid/cholesterol/gamma-HCH transport system permease protein